MSHLDNRLSALQAIIRGSQEFAPAVKQQAAEIIGDTLAALAAISNGWQPIETAPKDGSEVLLRVKLRAGIADGRLVGHYIQGGHCIEDHPPVDRGWYFWNGCMFDQASEPTHWMPLP